MRLYTSGLSKRETEARGGDVAQAEREIAFMCMRDVRLV
jgi:hypothetical protein